MSEKEKLVENIGPQLAELVDEIIDKAEELEVLGIDPESYDWSEFKARLDELNEDSEVRLVGVLLNRPKKDPQQKMENWLQ